MADSENSLQKRIFTLNTTPIVPNKPANDEKNNKQI